MIWGALTQRFSSKNFVLKAKRSAFTKRWNGLDSLWKCSTVLVFEGSNLAIFRDKSLKWIWLIQRFLADELLLNFEARKLLWWANRPQTVHWPSMVGQSIIIAVIISWWRLFHHQIKLSINSFENFHQKNEEFILDESLLFFWLF